VLAMHKEGLSYRLIGRNVGLSKNTVMQIVMHVDQIEDPQSSCPRLSQLVTGGSSMDYALYRMNPVKEGSCEGTLLRHCSH
jgi:hypothetical protein